MTVKFRVNGLRELDKALGELKKSTARGVARRALIKAGTPMKNKAAELAPRSSDGSYHFADSIIITSKKPKGYQDAGKQAFAETLSSGGSRGDAVEALKAARAANPNAFAEVYIGPNRDPAAIQQEFGNINHGPQPFLRPAWDSEREGVIDTLADLMWAEIRKTAQRLARKASR